jgi:hypothetical protein
MLLYSFGLILLIGGASISISTFRPAAQAVRGEGANKLRPLPWTYWSGLLMILAGSALQIAS